jgi:hypothetical protein
MESNTSRFNEFSPSSTLEKDPGATNLENELTNERPRPRRRDKLKSKCREIIQFMRDAFSQGRLNRSGWGSTWLPLDLQARYNEQVYGTRSYASDQVHFGLHRDSLEVACPDIVRAAIIERYYQEDRQAIIFNNMMVTGLC